MSLQGSDSIKGIQCHGSTFAVQTAAHVYWKGSLAKQTVDDWTDLAATQASTEDTALYDPEKIVRINVQDGALQLYQSNGVVFVAGSAEDFAQNS